MNKRLKKTIIVFSLILLVFSLFALFGFMFVSAYANKIDFTYDEMLFDAKHGSSVTRYFAKDSSGEYVLVDVNSGSEGKKIWYEYGEISTDLKNAFLAVEDRGFFEHSGVDYKRTAYAMLNQIFHFKNTFGASTITQQLIKNISGDNEITFERKLKEILRAQNIEKNHTKEEIFELYLNIVPMGENLFGVGTASEEYFGKTPSELRLEEAATLVGITNAPTKYNPHLNYENCLNKRNTVLYSMKECGYITQDEYEEAVSAALSVVKARDKGSDVDSWFIETVRDEVINDLVINKDISYDMAKMLVDSGGLSIYTTMNTDIQGILENYFENENNFPKEIKTGLQYSMVVCDSQDGSLIGIIGAAGKKTGERLLNYATSPHTPGSSLKPIALYAPLIDSGKINWATVFDDTPITFSEKNGVYTEYPKNYPRRYEGLINTKNALRLSKNTVAARMYGMLGAENIYHSLTKDFGFDSLVRSAYTDDGQRLTDIAISPLALGQLSYGVSLRKLTEAYTVFPSEGIKHASRSYELIIDKNGNELMRKSGEEKRIFKQSSARIMNQLLTEVVKNGTAKEITLKNIIDTAGKTGTSGDDKDRLFIGYTPSITAGIWCGYSNSDKTVGNLSKTHLKIWDTVMKKITEKTLGYSQSTPEFSTKGLSYLPYCIDSGKIYQEKCDLDPRGQRIEYGYFTGDNKPRGTCDIHKICLYDEVSAAIANDNCPSENLKEIALLDIPWRKFPKEIIITDAEYVYRSLNRDTKFGDSFENPYFMYALPEGEYVGRSNREKQYNSGCYIHDEE